MKRSTPLDQRFWRNVNVTKDDDCWIYSGCKNRKGYGYIGAGPPTHRTLTAHRVSYGLANGIDPVALPADVIVRHTCDNPPCVNPSHLLAGTITENNQDMVQRGRYRSHSMFINDRCLAGHDVGNPANVIVDPSRGRRCRTCYNLSQVKFRRRNKIRLSAQA